MTRPELVERLRRLERSQEYHADLFSRYGCYQFAEELRDFAAELAAIRTLLELHPLRRDTRPTYRRRKETPHAPALHSNPLLDAQPNRAGGGDRNL